MGVSQSADGDVACDVAESSCVEGDLLTSGSSEHTSLKYSERMRRWSEQRSNGGSWTLKMQHGIAKREAGIRRCRKLKLLALQSHRQELLREPTKLALVY